MYILKRFLVLSILFAVCSIALADKIFLKDKRIFEGEIISMDGPSVWILTQDKRTLGIVLENIDYVEKMDVETGQIHVLKVGVNGHLVDSHELGDSSNVRESMNTAEKEMEKSYHVDAIRSMSIEELKEALTEARFQGKVDHAKAIIQILDAKLSGELEGFKPEDKDLLTKDDGDTQREEIYKEQIEKLLKKERMRVEGEFEVKLQNTKNDLEVKYQHEKEKFGEVLKQGYENKLKAQMAKNREEDELRIGELIDKEVQEKVQLLLKKEKEQYEKDLLREINNVKLEMEKQFKQLLLDEVAKETNQLQVKLEKKQSSIEEESKRQFDRQLKEEKEKVKREQNTISNSLKAIETSYKEKIKRKEEKYKKDLKEALDHLRKQDEFIYSEKLKTEMASLQANISSQIEERINSEKEAVRVEEARKYEVKLADLTRKSKKNRSGRKTDLKKERLRIKEEETKKAKQQLLKDRENIEAEIEKSFDEKLIKKTNAIKMQYEQNLQVAVEELKQQSESEQKAVKISLQDAFDKEKLVFQASLDRDYKSRIQEEIEKAIEKERLEKDKRHDIEMKNLQQSMKKEIEERIAREYREKNMMLESALKNKSKEEKEQISKEILKAYDEKIVIAREEIRKEESIWYEQLLRKEKETLQKQLESELTKKTAKLESEGLRARDMALAEIRKTIREEESVKYQETIEQERIEVGKRIRAEEKDAYEGKLEKEIIRVQLDERRKLEKHLQDKILINEDVLARQYEKRLNDELDKITAKMTLQTTEAVKKERKAVMEEQSRKQQKEIEEIKGLYEARINRMGKEDRGMDREIKKVQADEKKKYEAKLMQEKAKIKDTLEKRYQEMMQEERQIIEDGKSQFEEETTRRLQKQYEEKLSQTKEAIRKELNRENLALKRNMEIERSRLVREKIGKMHDIEKTQYEKRLGVEIEKVKRSYVKMLQEEKVKIQKEAALRIGKEVEKQRDLIKKEEASEAKREVKTLRNQALEAEMKKIQMALEQEKEDIQRQERKKYEDTLAEYKEQMHIREQIVMHTVSADYEERQLQLNEALIHYGSVLEIDKDNVNALEGRDRVQKGLEERKRIQIEGLLFLASEKEKNGKWMAAINAYGQILKIEPQHQKALEGYKKMENVLKGQQSIEEMKGGLIEKAMMIKHIAEGNVKKVEKINKKSWLAKKSDKKKMRSYQYESEIDRLLRNLRSSINNRDYALAMQFCERALELDPDNHDVLQAITKIKKLKEIDLLHEKARTLRKDNKIIEMRREYEEILKLDPKDQVAQNWLQKTSHALSVGGELFQPAIELVLQSKTGKKGMSISKWFKSYRGRSKSMNWKTTKILSNTYRVVLERKRRGRIDEYVWIVDTNVESVKPVNKTARQLLSL